MRIYVVEPKNTYFCFMFLFYIHISFFNIFTVSFIHGLFSQNKIFLMIMKCFSH